MCANPIFKERFKGSSENMGRNPFKVFPGCGDDFFYVRIAKLSLDLERGRRLRREKQ